jgi:tetratricopeptide (TPR) repeat protein
MLLVALACGFPASGQPTSQGSVPPVAAPELFNRAGTALDAQQYESAVRDLSLFILLNPTYSPAYASRAEGYIGLSDMDHALVDVDHAINTATQATPDYGASLYTMRAGIDRQQQRLDDALTDYTQSIAIKPSMQAYANRGLLYMSRNETQAALKDLDSAIGLDATNPVLFVYRGSVQASLKDAKSAGADYLHFFSMIQPNPTVHAPLQSGQAVTLSIDQGVVIQLPFQAKKGQYASALASARSGDVDPLMVLIDSKGNALTGDDDSAGGVDALILNYVIPADGVYAFDVGHSLGGYTGSVQLQFQVSDTPAQ